MITGNRDADGKWNLHVVGKVAKEPEVRTGQKADLVKFSVLYGKSKFMNVTFFSNSTAGQLASCLEKGDHVAVDGVLQEWEYEGKSYSDLQGEFLQVQMEAPVAEEEEKEEEAQAGNA